MWVEFGEMGEIKRDRNESGWLGNKGKEGEGRGITSEERKRGKTEEKEEAGRKKVSEKIGEKIQVRKMCWMVKKKKEWKAP